MYNEERKINLGLKNLNNKFYRSFYIYISEMWKLGGIMNNFWNGKRYHSLNYFLRDKFGEKVFKISLDGGFSCPNRDGKISSGGCLFCSESGSGDYAGDRELSITKQFNDIKEMMAHKWKGGKYIAYFQAYTNTYAPTEELRRKYEEALNQDGVVAIAIATRPDCLGDEYWIY